MLLEGGSDSGVAEPAVARVVRSSLSGGKQTENGGEHLAKPAVIGDSGGSAGFR